MSLVETIPPKIGAYRFFSQLEALRGVCAIGVVCLHFPWASIYGRVPALRQSWLFVDLFFVLSGFLMAHVYLNRLTGLQEVRDFAIKRFFRLYPLHLVTLAACTLLILGKAMLGLGWKDGFTAGQALAALTLVHGLGFTEALPLNMPSWSISTEVAAYVVFVVCCLATRHRVAAMVMVALMGLAVELTLNHATLDGAAKYRVFRCLYGFGMGVFAWRVAPAFKWPALQWPALAGAIAILWLANSLTQVSLAFPLAAGFLISTLTIEGPITRILSLRPFTAIGRWSFSIYLVHTFILQIFGFALNRLVKERMGTEPWLPLGEDLALAVVVLAVVIAVSAVTYRLIEVPGRDLGRRIIERGYRRRAGLGDIDQPALAMSKSPPRGQAQ